MISTADATTVAMSATVVAVGLGTALTVAILGAALSAAFPGSWPGARAWAVRALVWLWGAFTWLPRITWGLGVTFLHLPTLGRRKHRFSYVSAWVDGVRTKSGQRGRFAGVWA